MNATASVPLFAIPDFEFGASYLARLPLANPAEADQQLNRFLDSLLNAPPAANDFFALLEQSRVPMAFIESEMSRRYHSKPLPLGDVEEGYFRQVVATWQKMAKAYALCAQLGEANTADPRYATRIATILHRCLYYTGMVIMEHYRARRELPPGIWLDFHGYYETAEEWGIAAVPVEDGVESQSGSTHCTAAYVALLLIEIASPYSNSVRDLNLIRRWANLWAPLVPVHRVFPEEPLPYVVELMKDAGLHPPERNQPYGDDTRRLDTSALAAQISQMLSQLKQRIPPSQLGLGEEAAGHVTILLNQVSRPWAMSAAARKFRRFATSGTARVYLGFEAIHYAISGKEFDQHPEAGKSYSRSDFDALFTFRHMADPTRNLTIQQPLSFPMDEWDVVNHSANGFRLCRSTVGQKMAHGQLLAICPHDGDKFLLAQSTWLMQEQEGGLIAGVAALPGSPSGVAIRLVDDRMEPNKPFVRAFLLSPVPAMKEPGSIVMPLGMYQASRPLEIYAGGYWRVVLKNIVQRGVDFERVTFEAV